MGLEGIPQTMTACQIVEYNEPYKLNVVTTPQNLSDYDILIRVAVASLCHTDFMVSAGIFHTHLPCTASHEGAGTVAALGSRVQGFKVGDRVLCGLTYGRCGSCATCQGRENQRQYCLNNQGAIGIFRDGNFAEYVIVDSREASHLPGSVSFQSAAPLACAGTTIWGGITKANLKRGQWIAIVGAGGGLGHLGVQFAKAQGLHVIGIDARDEGLQLSKDCGADVVLDAREGKDALVNGVKRVTHGQGADATLNVSDHSSAAANAAAVTKMHGTMIQIAQPAEVTIPFAELVFRDVKICGSLISSRGETQEMLEFVAEHGIKVKTNAFLGLTEIPKLVEFAHSGKMSGKGVVIIDQDAVNKEKESGLKMV